MRLFAAAAALLGVGLGIAAGAESGRAEQKVLSAVEGLPSLSMYNAAGGSVSSVISRPLGASTGEIPDERFTASSVYRAEYSLFNPWFARSNSRHEDPSDGAWRAATDVAGEYLQVDLGREYIITAIATQGQHTAPNWVSKYRLQHSKDNIAWKQYPGDFTGNYDSDTVVINDIHQKIVARYVRVVAAEWNGHIALRAEVFGYSPECAAQEEERVIGVPCAGASAYGGAGGRYGEGEGEAVISKPAGPRQYTHGFPLGLESGIISDGSLSASSVYVPKSPLFDGGNCAVYLQKKSEGGAPAPAPITNAPGIAPPAAAAAPAAPAPAAAAAAPAAAAPAAAPAPAPAGPARFMAVSSELTTDAAWEDANDAILREMNSAEVRPSRSVSREHSSHSDSRFKAMVGNDTANGSNGYQSTDGSPDCGVFKRYGPQFGRLNMLPQPYKSGGWKAGQQQLGEYLQLDLGALQEIDAVATQGRENSEDWVTAFSLEYSSNGRQWEALESPFSANSDSSTVVKHVLPRPLLTRYLRFVVKGFHSSIGLRVEVFGPGRGQGCMLRCYAARIAQSTGFRDLESALAAANSAGAAASFLELASSSSSEARALQQLGAALGVDAFAQASQLLSCCGCPCCASIMQAPCGAAGGARKQAAAGSLSVVQAAGEGQAVPVAGAAANAGAAAVPQLDAGVAEAVAANVRVLLRGGAPGGGEGPAYSGANARTAVAAEDKKIAAAVSVPGSSKTFYVVQREE